MNIALLIVTILLARQLSYVSISKKTYHWIRGITIMVVLISTVLVLNNSAFAELANLAAEALKSVGIGNPKSWEMRSREYRDVIDACYYLSLFGTLILTLAMVSYEHKDMAVARTKELLLFALPIFILAALFYGVFFVEYYPSRSGGVPSTKFVLTMYNTKFGLVAMSPILLHLGDFYGLVLRGFFQQGKSLKS